MADLARSLPGSDRNDRRHLVPLSAKSCGARFDRASLTHLSTRPEVATTPKPPRHYGQSFFGADGIAESPSGVIYADASPFPFLPFYCNVELTPSGGAKALCKS
jgi:hypothetical protein